MNTENTHPTDDADNAVAAALVPVHDDWEEPERYPTLLGVECDAEAPTEHDGECQNFLEGDFVVHRDDTRATRLGYILDHAATQGWTIIGRHHPETALTYCLTHQQAGHDFAAKIEKIKAERTG